MTTILIILLVVLLLGGGGGYYGYNRYGGGGLGRPGAGDLAGAVARRSTRHARIATFARHI